MRGRSIVAASRRKQVSSVPDPLFSYDWSGGTTAGETVTRAGTATVINSSGNRVLASANTPRIDHTGESPNTVLGLMVEPAATNYALQSRNLQGAGWGSTNLTIAAAAGTGMDGTNSLYSFTATAADNAQFNRVVTFPSGSRITATWYMKEGTGRWVLFTMHNDPNYSAQAHVFFDLQTGMSGNPVSPSGTAFSNVTTSGRKLGNGIAEMVMSVQTTGITQILLQCNMAGGDNVWSGTSGHVRYFDSVQVEVGGASTSYIPTLAETVSRGIETVTVPMTTGSYDILVTDAAGGEWRNNVSVTNPYTITPKTGKRHVRRVAAYAVNALSAAQKEVLAAPPPFPYTSGLILTWRDEFTDTNLNRFSDSGTVTSAGGGKPWRTRFAHGGGGFSSATINNESQVYTASSPGGYLGLNPFEISNSVLKIRLARIPNGTANVPPNTRYDPDAPYRHYSGMISSEPNKLFTYGVFEIRSRSEAKFGTWPAFWLIRTIPDGLQNLGGEIDIFEHMGDDPDQTHQTFHEWDAAHFVSAKQPVFPNGGTIADWHVYACRWEPNLVVFYVDGIETHRVVGRSFLNDRQMILIANLAANVSMWRESGATEEERLAKIAEADKTGVWEPPDNLLPALLEIDYIRVYQSTGSPDNS